MTRARHARFVVALARLVACAVPSGGGIPTPRTLHDTPRFTALLEGTNEQSGRVLAALERLGRAKDRPVVLTLDNGGVGEVASMAPRRGLKGTYCEGGDPGPAGRALARARGGGEPE